ncbi:flavodoxin [Lacrimispora sp.]|uniref:flavodoxin n=1 Tax=Lacrimispora sp. TaxID=2719234 RepID=UPI0032E393C4
MKRITALFLLLTMIFSLAACGKSSDNSSDASTESPESEQSVSESEPETPQPSRQNSRVLIAYFSIPEDVSTDGVDAIAGASVMVKEGEKMGNTEYVAKMIQETVGGDLFRIETTESYPLVHDPLVEQAAEEQDADERPELATHIENLERYDTIILGYPNWCGDLPQPLYTFLEEYDFGAKTIIPFVPHGGSGFSNTRDTISQLQPGAFVSDNTLSLSRNDVADSEDEVIAWAVSLGLHAEDEMPENNTDTVATVVADPVNQQTLYLWEEGNVPTTTEYTENTGNYFDYPDFYSYVVTFPAPICGLQSAAYLFLLWHP